MTQGNPRHARSLWTPRRVANMVLALAAGAGGAVVHLFYPGAPWAALALALAAGVLLGLARPDSPLDSLLDRVVGPDDAPRGGMMSEDDERRIRDAIERGRREGSAALDVLGAVVSFALGLALLLARGGL